MHDRFLAGPEGIEAESLLELDSEGGGRELGERCIVHRAKHNEPKANCDGSDGY